MVTEGHPEIIERSNEAIFGGQQPWVSYITPYYFFRRKEVLLDSYNLDHIQRAAEALANGEVIINNMCGVMGFVIDGTQENAIDQVLEMKGRPKTSPLVIGGSLLTRSRLIASERFPEGFQMPDVSVYDLPHFFEYPVDKNLVPEGIGMRNDRLGRVGVIFWANYYLPIASLEVALQARNRNGFLSGTSANCPGQRPPQNAVESFHQFGMNRRGVNIILADHKFEKDRIFGGSHIMLGLGEHGQINPLRPGSISLRSYLAVYPQLSIPANWVDVPGSVDIDVNQLRNARSYLREPFSKARQSYLKIKYQA